MDPDTKIVDLSEHQLIALGFLGKDAQPVVRRIVEKVKADPDQLGTVTWFMVDCLKRKEETPSPSLRYSRPGEDDSDIYAIVAPHLISPFEQHRYYHGVSGNPPLLMYRSDLETNPYPTRAPRGVHIWTTPRRTAHGVFNTPLNRHWDTVAPKILAWVKARGIKYSALKTVRFWIVDYADRGAFGPVVVWIAVRPNTTNAAALRDATPGILRILADFDITDVAVEWYEGSIVKLANPPLMNVVSEFSPKFGLSHPFNTGLGIPIARQSDDAQGTVTLLFKEVKTSTGEPSDRILALTNKHITCANIATDYELDGTHLQHMLLCGARRFARAVAEIEEAVTTGLRTAIALAERIMELEAKLGTPNEDSTALRRAKDDLERRNERNLALQAFFAEASADWKDSDNQDLGIVEWAPSVSVGVDDHHHTRDIATIEVDQTKLKNFEGNVVDLGDQYNAVEIVNFFWPVTAMSERKEIPYNSKLPLHKVVPRRLLNSPNTEGENGEPLLVVGKYGSATKLTFGRCSGTDAYICDDLGQESREVAIYNYGRTAASYYYGRSVGDFSKYGDSGSLIFTGDGDALAMLHSGMPRGSSNHVSYGTPIWWVVQQILVKYPFAEFCGITLDQD